MEMFSIFLIIKAFILGLACFYFWNPQSREVSAARTGQKGVFHLVLRLREKVMDLQELTIAGNRSAFGFRLSLRLPHLCLSAEAKSS